MEIKTPITPDMVIRCREKMATMKGQMIMVPLRVIDDGEEDGKRKMKKLKSCPALLKEVYPHGVLTDEGFFQWFDIITRN